MNFIEKNLFLRDLIRRFILGWFAPSILAAEEYRSKLNKTLQQHWQDHPIEIYELIFELWDDKKDIPIDSKNESSEDFIVFIDSQLDVDWIDTSSLDSKSTECISSAESIGAKRCRHLPKEQILEFKRLIGQSIVNGIRKNYKQSVKLTFQAVEFLKDRTIERSRIWTLFSAHGILTFIAASVFFFSNSFELDYWHQNIPAGLCYAIAGGTLGAYLSVIQNAGSGQWDAASGRAIHFLEVFTKIAAGSAFGLVAYMISQSVHAPPALRSITPDSASLFVFGLASGLFERLIPKMVSKYSPSESISTDIKPNET